MKLSCETSVLHRINQINTKSRTLKSTIVLAAHPPNGEKSEILLILFTAQNKTGQRYKIKNNIKKLFTRCINDGKMTISIIEPEHDILIKSEPIQLKCFLKILSLGLEGKHKTERIGLSSIMSTPIASNAHPKTKMIITSRGDYPVKGFPRTLEQLKINGLQLQRITSQILFLKNLTTLDLGENSITKIPKDFGDLNLRELHLNKNNLGDSLTGCNWHWLEGEGLRKHLNFLNLNENNLQKFPSNLLNLKNLVTLKLNGNKIDRIPLAINRLNRLRFLYIANNQLETIPATILTYRFDTIDLSGNKFNDTNQHKAKITTVIDPLSLWKLAAHAVDYYKINYSVKVLPKYLCEILDKTPKCHCGRLCFTGNIIEKSFFITLNAINLIKDDSQILADNIYCTYCFFVKPKSN